MIKVGDRVKVDRATLPELERLLRSEMGTIESLLPQGFKHVDNTIPEGRVKDICIIWAKMDCGLRLGLGFRSIIEINGYPKPSTFQAPQKPRRRRF